MGRQRAVVPRPAGGAARVRPHRRSAHGRQRRHRAGGRARDARGLRQPGRHRARRGRRAATRRSPSGSRRADRRGAASSSRTRRTSYETTRGALENYARFVPPRRLHGRRGRLRRRRGPPLCRTGRAACCRRSRTGSPRRRATASTVRRDLELYGVTCHPSGFLQRRAARRWRDRRHRRARADRRRADVDVRVRARRRHAHADDDPGAHGHPSHPAAVTEPVARAALARDGARAIDLACSEGWFSHRLLEWGAQSVTAIDIREENVRRAELVRAHLDIDAQRLSLRRADVFELAPAVLGTFDVVLCFGLIYHLKNPVGALRIARALTSGVCLVESQLTEQVAPIRHGWGQTGAFLEQEASWAAYHEPATVQEDHPIAAHADGKPAVRRRAPRRRRGLALSREGLISERSARTASPGPTAPRPFHRSPAGPRDRSTGAAAGRPARPVRGRRAPSHSTVDTCATRRPPRRSALRQRVRTP